MCDNCKTGKVVDEIDMTDTSLRLVEVVSEIARFQGKITSKALVDLVKGK